jgi:hypothetical protein
MLKENKQNNAVAKVPTLVTVRRALGISRIYIGIAMFFAILAIVIWNPSLYLSLSPSTNSTASNSTASNAISSNTVAHNSTIIGKSSEASGPGLPLLAVPLDMVPTLMLATPVILLFVYDKNNGMLEYLLSLGMTQRDVYMQYLKAALVMTFAFLLIFVSVNVAYFYVKYGSALTMSILPIALLVIPLALAVVTFMVICMMAFSSLQKTRAGSNQPLGLIIGWVGTIPAYLTPFVFSFGIGIYVDLAIAAVIIVVSSILLLSAGKLIRREKLLP